MLQKPILASACPNSTLTERLPTGCDRLLLRDSRRPSLPAGRWHKRDIGDRAADMDLSIKLEPKASPVRDQRLAISAREREFGKSGG